MIATLNIRDQGMMEMTDLRARAAESERKAQESWDRSDTDGFMSQWALGLSASKDRLQAEIDENGGRFEFAALFDLDGNLVPAKLIDTRYGLAWGILPDDDPHGRFVRWFNPSSARSDVTRLKNNRRKGYTEGRVLAPAKAVLSGTNATSVRAVPLRTDGGFSRDVEIVETETQHW